MKKNLAIQQAYLQTLADTNTDRLTFIREKYSHHPLTKQEIVELLSIAVIDQWLAEFNYFASYNLAQTQNRSDYIDQFAKHQDEQRAHRKDIVQRIRQLGGKAPIDMIQQFQIKNSAGQEWKQQMDINSDAILARRYNEQILAVKFYQMILQLLKISGVNDTTTQQLIKDIKGDEQQHAKDLRDLAVQHNVQLRETV